MAYFNQFHKEASERKMRKIAEWEQSPMNSRGFLRYMFLYLEQAEMMEQSSLIQNKLQEAMNSRSLL